jgi:hypothetical protein
MCFVFFLEKRRRTARHYIKKREKRSKEDQIQGVSYGGREVENSETKKDPSSKLHYTANQKIPSPWN